MTIFAEGRHSYSTVGEFKVKVTAVNPLGNETAWLPHSFWVQEPPKDLHFCDEANNERIARYTGEVGEVVTMVAKVVSGNEVKFDWKLGDQTDLVNKGSVVQHQYMTPGVKTVYVTAYNKVRTLTRAVKVFINYKIQGVELLVDSNVLSLKQTMIYTAVVRPDIPHIATSYYWTFKSPTMIQGRYIIGGIKKYSSKQNAVQHTFHVIGECTATVTALNAISNATSVSVELYVYLPILLPEIYISSNKVNLLVNQPIKIKFHKYDGTNVTLKWDFGDESDPIITNMHVSNSLEVKHTFIREGAYNITVLAENPVSSVTVYKMLFILNKSYCEEPKVTIVANTEHIEIVHSRYFTLEADVTMDCNLTSAVAYHWSIDDHVTMYNVEMMNRVLVLPPRLLKYGKHTVKFKVEMLGTIVYGKATRVVEVIPSPLVSKIHGGVFRRIRSDGEIVIDGSGSFDPDHLHNNQLRYHWKCSFLMENGTYGESCFVNSTHDALLNSTHNASCIVAMDTAVLSFLGDCLVPASNFTFELTVSADGRQNGTSSQIIALEQDNAQILNVKIVRPYSMSDPVNADRKLSFYVQCTNCKSEGVKYEWTIKHLAGYNIHNYARAHDLPCVDKEGRAYAQVLENDTDSDEPTDQGADLSKNNDKGQGGQEIIPFTIGSEVSSDMTTTVSVLSYVEIVEGKSSTENRRQRSTVKDINNIDYPRVEEQADSKRRVKTSSRNLDIVEEKSGGNIGRGVTRFQAPEEGTPGESGSSGGRQYSYIPVEEPGSKRKVYPNPLDEPENEDGGSGLFLDKLEGSRKYNLRQRSILEMPMIRYYLPKEKTRTGLDGESLVIKPGFLKQGLTYFLQVKVTDEEGERFGEAVSSFVVNESPVHGSCTVLPDNGVELDTEFRVMCQAWQDKHKPLMYEVSYKLDKHEDRKLIYRGVNGEFPIRLPAGKPQNDYNVNVYIDILDGLLAKTSVCSITIRVTPKTLTDDSGKELYSDARSIYEEIVSANGVFKKSVDRGDDAISKVSIIYLATRLNTLNDSANTLLQGDNNTAYSIDNSNATYVIDEIADEKEDLKYRRDARRKLLEVLERLPVRDEAEILQSAQALSLTTAVPDELDISSLYLSLKILESVCVGAEKVYQDELTPTGDLVQLVVATASSIIKGTMDLDEVEDETFKYMHKQMINNAIKNVNKLILNELKFHLVFEEPVMSSSEVLSVWASRHSVSDNHTLSIGETKFKVPSHLGSSSNAKISRPGSSIDDVIVGKAANEKCIQSHMTSFTLNPFGLEDRKKIQSLVAGLNVYDCEGKLLHVVDLPPGNEIQIQLPNKPPKTVVFEDLVLNKWSMNVHQFNITTIDLQHALHFLIDFTSLKEGRLFPITVLLSFTRPPSPDFYQHKYEIEAGEDNMDIFLPAGTFNATGMYYIGIVDSTYNSKRLRPGEVTQRNYTLKLWWSQCLYWNMDKEVWLPDGCSISQNSTFEVTKCTCNHLTSFGGRFELIPNKLTLTDIEGLFSLHQNPVTLTLVSVVLLFYCLLFFWCYRADLYDNRKGGIVYLLDNSPMDQQKFEITVETGLWNGAGTTAKISIILHGEEGMSETRELISEDDRPMFERNSRDKFILSLPDSIGRIWKVQIWHNNLGPSPSWYLNRVIVRDLNTGNQYIFICEKRLAVEEQDGKVEREFMVLDGTLQFKKALPSKVVQYMADFHIWMSLLTCPPYGGFMRTERLTVCLTMLLVYMCLNAMWYKVTVTEVSYTLPTIYI
ncbi:polycystin-1-related protein-like isoform X2 [Ruditapes philippinarum]|nr:polycystin-1-related protein-like isoform X2 [Ruditapes philippinarum]